jgi:hypothetical protein
MALKDILVRKSKVKDAGSKLLLKVAPVSTTVRIPACEKRVMIPDAPSLVVETSTTKDRIVFYSWFQAFLSKHPRFVYLCYTKSSWSCNKKIYWFLNKDTNIKVLLSKEEIKQRTNLMLKKTTGALDVVYTLDSGASINEQFKNKL